MGINRRDFLKLSAGSGLLLASDVTPSFAASAHLPHNAVGILYDATLCIGCKSCMVNCKKYNSMEGGALQRDDGSIPYEHITPNKIYDAPAELSSKTLNIIKTYQSGTGLNKDTEADGYSFVKTHCLHCLDPACASVCPVGALHKDPDNGVVSYDSDKCIGCRYCQMACPFGIHKYEWEKASPSIVKCQLCHHRFKDGGYSACCEFCPTGASIFGKVTDLREEAKKRLTLTPGSYYDYPLQTVSSSAKMPKKVSKYYDHIYGMEEAGGTQYLLMAGVSFDKLGFNPNITSQAYPELTWGYIKKIPWLIGALIIAGAASHLVTRDKIEQQAEQD
jgi:Fe-S-cluster-containing dehydrogenase component